MRSFLKFNRGVLRLPLQWRLWMMLLVAANMVVPLFFLGHLEAQAVLVALLLSLVLTSAFMKVKASRANCSSLSYIRRQILVAAAISGRANPNASTVNQPS